MADYGKGVSRYTANAIYQEYFVREIPNRVLGITSGILAVVTIYLFVKRIRQKDIRSFAKLMAFIFAILNFAIIAGFLAFYGIYYYYNCFGIENTAIY